MVALYIYDIRWVLIISNVIPTTMKFYVPERTAEITVVLVSLVIRIRALFSSKRCVFRILGYQQEKSKARKTRPFLLEARKALNTGIEGSKRGARVYSLLSR